MLLKIAKGKFASYICLLCICLFGIESYFNWKGLGPVFSFKILHPFLFTWVKMSRINIFFPLSLSPKMRMNCMNDVFSLSLLFSLSLSLSRLPELILLRCCFMKATRLRGLSGNGSPFWRQINSCKCHERTNLFLHGRCNSEAPNVTGNEKNGIQF